MLSVKPRVWHSEVGGWCGDASGRGEGRVLVGPVVVRLVLYCG